MASNTVPQSFSRLISAVPCYFFFSWVHCKRQVQFLSPCLVGQFHFHKFPQRSMYFMRWNRSAIIGFLQANKSSADRGTFFYFTISVYRFDSDFHLPSIPLRPLPFHQEAVWPLHSLLQASQKYLRTLRRHGLLDIPILLPFDLLFSRFWFYRRHLSPFWFFVSDNDNTVRSGSADSAMTGSSRPCTCQTRKIFGMPLPARSPISIRLIWKSQSWLSPFGLPQKSALCPESFF